MGNLRQKYTDEEWDELLKTPAITRNNKVYIVKTYQGDHDDSWWNIHCVCSDAHKAEKEKRKLEKRIENIKAEYENEFGRNYDKDVEDVMGLDKEDRYKKVYPYQDKYEELGYHTIRIDEHKIL